MSTKEHKAISVVGLGKLGLPFALTFAHAGYNVIGLDGSDAIVENIQKGRCLLYEENIQKYFKSNLKDIYITRSYDEVVLKTNITFIIVPTPSERDGHFSNQYILQVIEKLGKAIRKKDKNHIVVITSTVSPNSLQLVIGPQLEHASKKKIGEGIGLCYSPEFIALGSVIRNLTTPDLILIGESDIKSGTIVQKIRKSICINNPRIIRTNWINAEISKIALNTYITTKISFANMIARLCEHVPDANAHVITDVLGSDKRVGKAYLKGGLGFGGPCFPRDNKALASYIDSIGQNSDIPRTIQTFNIQQTNEIYKIVEKYISKNTRVGILGLSYKPGTDVIDESPSILLAKKLILRGIKVNGYDPAAMNNTKKVVPEMVLFSSVHECIVDSHVIVIATEWKEFRTISWSKDTKQTKKIIIDCWGIIDKKKIKSQKITRITLGKHIS